MAQLSIPLPPDIGEVVALALNEDQGDGDLTAKLIDANATTTAQVTVHDVVTLSGCAWFDEVFRQLDDRVAVQWNFSDGMELTPAQPVCDITGPSRPILTGERTALNFLQTLSGTATAVREHVLAVAATQARILDTRKTIPCLRRAQKYAVLCGGGENHRMGLYDGVLIKENHIVAAGGILAAAGAAREREPATPIEIEVETLDQLREALTADVDRILLDNFSLTSLSAAVAVRDAHDGPRKQLEASGGIGLENLRAIAATGVDFISVGALTKHVRAVDFSMRFL